MSSQKYSKKTMIIFYRAVILWLELCVHTDEGGSFVAQEKQTILLALGLCSPLPCKEHQGPVPENGVLSHTSPIPSYLQYPLSFQAPSLPTELCVPVHKQVHAFWFTGQETKGMENQWAPRSMRPFSGSPFSNTCSSPICLTFDCN